MSATAFQITCVSIVYSTVYSSAYKKHQSSTSLAFGREIHRWPVNSPHKGPVTREMFPFDDVIMTHWGWDKIAAISQVIFKRISVKETVWILIENSLKFFGNGSIDNTSALVQVMACHMVSVFHIWRHQRRVERARNAIDDVAIANPTAAQIRGRCIRVYCLFNNCFC